MNEQEVSAVFCEFSRSTSLRAESPSIFLDSITKILVQNRYPLPYNFVLLRVQERKNISVN